MLKRRGHCRSRIVATLGPATSSPRALARLIRAGVDVVRLNFSHGTHAEHRALYHAVRKAAAERKACVAVMADLGGPKLRLGRLQDDEVLLKRGARVDVVEEPGLGTVERLTVEAEGVVAGLTKGRSIRLRDGLVELIVEKRVPGGVRCRVTHGGAVRSRQGVNLPGALGHLRAFTAKDRKDLAFALDLGVDAVAVSFVRDGDDLRAVRRFCKRRHRDPFLVAKIERAEAVESLDDIIAACDGVMVARGDLGVEIGVHRVPMEQKRILRAARLAQRPTITATQMLESMVENASATRAEVSDVANAVLDGTDALMLSAETAVGQHPVAAVETLVRVAREVELAALDLLPRDELAAPEGGTDELPLACSRAARVAAQACGAAALMAFSNSGRTVRLVSSQRPRRPIFGATHREETWRRMRFYWGVRPMLIRHAPRVSLMIAEAEQLLRDHRLVPKGARIVVVCGESVVSGATNSVKIHVMGETDGVETARRAAAAQARGARK